MAKAKKRYPPLIRPENTGRFTWEQLDAAVLKVMQETERKAARAAARKKQGGSSKPASAPAEEPRKARRAPKAA